MGTLYRGVSGPTLDAATRGHLGVISFATD